MNRRERDAFIGAIQVTHGVLIQSRLHQEGKYQWQGTLCPCQGSW